MYQTDFNVTPIELLLTESEAQGERLIIIKYDEEKVYERRNSRGKS